MLKRCIIVFSLLFMVGCGAEPGNKMGMNTEISQENNNQKVNNKWFDDTEIVAYRGDFTFSEDRDTLDCGIQTLYIGESPQGVLYQLTIDVSDAAQVPEELLNIGFFYVENDTIIRMLELSEEEKRKLLIDGEIPDSATVVCQDNEIKDKCEGKGWHEQVLTNEDLVAYNRGNDERAKTFYEIIVWKENVGIILYTRGYAAELDAITMWRDEYVEKPHEFDLSKSFK